ncbi:MULTISPECIES: PadR family transcriptional regulator [Microbacterium]|uniref:PadR family transcriptional regulator n=1 Tax=Microbacterium TaxID=33882 RepID=UPI001E538DAB|nr:PadR family transcriptional regulator [Microbacterium nymphoidis]MCD2497376.1 PadR family transcriptional regulator [Microbacterium nymphoidis]
MVAPSSSDSARSAPWPSDWLRAMLGAFTLRALESGPSYGYAIITQLEASGFGVVKGGTLYPLLSRYEAAGLVRAEWRPGDAGPGRKFFALTEEGRSELNRVRTMWLQFATVSAAYMTEPRADTGEES